MADKSDILQGTLDLMVLKTLEAMGPLHGYGIARRIEQISEDALQINQGTIYASLVRLVQKRWIAGAWGTSENHRKAKFYELGTHFRCDRPGAAHRGAGIVRCPPRHLPGSLSWPRGFAFGFRRVR
jgi:PadR family transcriptional regulator PadR